MFTSNEERLLGKMRTELADAVLVLNLLLEGMSLRSVRRVTGKAPATANGSTFGSYAREALHPADQRPQQDVFFVHHSAMTSLFVAWYNFCWKHETLGKNTTPAMAAGLTDHVWTLEELLTAAA